jgi:dihydropteroate synthase
MIPEENRQSSWICGTHTLEIGKRTLIMGVVNVTPDSFSDGGQFIETHKAVEHAIRLASEGADIIDIGGESTRPGSDPVVPNVEIERVLPVVEQAAAEISIPISIDTTKAVVARSTLNAGASIVNDISGFRFDPELPKVVADHGSGIILMHIRDNPTTMQANTYYHDIFKEIKEYLHKSIQIALSEGIAQNSIAIDPGIGFGKSLTDNYRLIDHLDYFRELRCPIVVGPSRKSFIGKVLDLPADQRIWGTAAAVACSILSGADIVRVHDVKEMVQVARICDMFRQVRHDKGNIAEV